MAGEDKNPESQPKRKNVIFSGVLVADENWMREFAIRLKEFLTEKQIEVPKNAPGALGYASYGSSLVENLKECLRPLPADARKSGGMLIVKWKPWYRHLWENLRDTIAPSKLPPLQVTSKPVQVRDIWSKQQGLKQAQALSLTIHALVIVSLMVPLYQSTEPTGDKPPDEARFPLWFPLLPPGNDKANGGGGGGERNPLQPTRGKLPAFAMLQLAPAMAVVRNLNPKLAVEPTVIVPPEISFPNPPLLNYGDPMQPLFTASAGPGSNGGFGTGKRGGIGSGDGAGVGPGSGGGTGGNEYARGGNGVSYPECLYCPRPGYSDEARKAKYQGTVTLKCLITPDGRATNISVARGLGMGLDEEAIEAVRNWKFKPSTGRDGKPVQAWVLIEVNFRLL